MEAPHMASPFTILRSGVQTVEQDTPQEIAGCVYNICVCAEGEREDDPSFGRPELAGGPVPIDLAALESAILRQEPRADLDVTEQASAVSQALREVGIEVS